MPLEQIRSQHSFLSDVSSGSNSSSSVNVAAESSSAAAQRGASGSASPVPPRAALERLHTHSPVQGTSPVPWWGTSSLSSTGGGGAGSSSSVHSSSYEGHEAGLRRGDEPSRMTLLKLGGVGGVTRSGSWGRASASLHADSSRESGAAELTASPETLEDAAASHKAEPSLGSSMHAAEQSAETHHRSSSSDVPSSSSRTSTSSYSAAAFSLRSLSNRNSTSSAASTSSSASSSIRSPADSSSSYALREGSEPGTDAGSEQTARDTHSGRGSPDKREWDEDHSLARSRVGPSVSRVQSFGRGGGEQYRSSLREEPTDEQPQQPRSNQAYVGPGLNRIRSFGRGGTPKDEAPPPPSFAQHIAEMEEAPPPPPPVAKAEPAQLSSESDPTPPASSTPLAADAPPAPPPRLSSLNTEQLSPKPVLHLDLPGVADDSGAAGSRSSALQVPLSAPLLLPGQSQDNISPTPFARTPSPALSALAVAAAQAEASVPLVFTGDLAAQLPRRHSGAFALRTRSALSQHAGLHMTFGGGGMGRAAERRRDSSALSANAPFSELEARRAMALAEASAAKRAGGLSQPTSPLMLQAWTPLTSFGASSERAGAPPSAVVSHDSALSPMAQASPDAAALSSSWLSSGSGAGLVPGRHSSAFASLASFSDIGDMLGASASSEGLADSASASSATSAPRSGLLAAASEEQAAAQRTRSGASVWRQHARQTLAPIDVPPPLDLPAGAAASDPLSAGLGISAHQPASSPGGGSSPGFPTSAGGRPSLQRSSTGLSSGLGTHVLRTPTTEEWSRFLARQTAGGVMATPLTSLPRSRSATARSTGVPLGALSRRTPAPTPPNGRVASSRTGSARGGDAADLSDESDDDDVPLDPLEAAQEQSTLEHLRALSLSGAARSRTGSLIGVEADLESVREGDESDSSSISDDDEYQRSEGSHDSHFSASSSVERMRALHEAISRPGSNRGTPTISRAHSPDRSFGAVRTGSPPAVPEKNAPRGSSSPSLHGERRASHVHAHAPPEGAPSVTASSSKHPRRPTRDTAAGVLGYPLAPPGERHTINDFVVISDIGRGAYGLVKKVRLKGPDGEAVGDDFCIKYIIKSRILADCWRRHRSLGPIPVEIHVMDQLRRLPYSPPATLPPWAPERLFGQPHTPAIGAPATGDTLVPPKSAAALSQPSSPTTPHASSANGIDLGVAHPSLCTMVDFFEDHEFYYLVMPCLTGAGPGHGAGQDLFDFVESAPDGLSTIQVRSIFGQVADGVRFLHANSIVHRDLKDENVILDFRYGYAHAQLIDFGSAAHVRPGRLFDTFSGTLDYAAAEILRGEKYAGKEQDVWALGVVGYVLLCGDCPFWNGDEAVEGLAQGSRAQSALRDRCLMGEGARASMQDGAPDASSNGGHEDGGGRLEDAADLISQCLQLNPAERPTAAEVCQHRFLVGASGWHGWKGWLTEAASTPTASPPLG